MARILILAPQLPYPPQQGTTLRNYNIIAGLARRGHVVDLATFAEDDGSGPMQAYCRRIVTAPQPVRSTVQRARDTILQGLPDMALRLQSPLMHARLAEFLAGQTFDVLQVEGIEMAPYALALPAAQRACLVFDDHNAEYVLQQRAFQTDARSPWRWLAAGYSLVQWQKLVRYERRICRAAGHVVAVSETDRLALQRILPGLPVTVVPNGVDLGYFRPGAAEPLAGLRRPALVFTGKMDYRPNVDAALWFARKVLPLIQARLPEAHFYVVGQQPHVRLAALAHQPGVTVTGRVPDTRPYMAGAGVYVVPLRIGGGTRLKVLEAMAMGLPVVSTRLGCDGFDFVDGRELRYADTPADFAAAVFELLGNPAQAAAFGQAARAHVAGRYGWEAIVPKLEGLYAV